MAGIVLGRQRSSWKEKSNPRQCGASLLDSPGEDEEGDEAELVVVLNLLGSASIDDAVLGKGGLGHGHGEERGRGRTWEGLR